MELSPHLIDQLENGLCGDFVLMLDDGTDIHMHQSVVAIHAPYLQWLGGNRGVTMHNTLYVRLLNVTRRNVLMLRKYIYRGRVIVQDTNLLSLLLDGSMLHVFDYLSTNCDQAEAGHYLVVRVATPESFQPRGMHFFEDGLEVVDYDQQLIQEVFASSTGNDNVSRVVEPRVEMPEPVGHVSPEVQYYCPATCIHCQNVPAGYEDEDWEMEDVDIEVINDQPEANDLPVPFDDNHGDLVEGILPLPLNVALVELERCETPIFVESVMESNANVPEVGRAEVVQVEVGQVEVGQAEVVQALVEIPLPLRPDDLPNVRENPQDE